MTTEKGAQAKVYKQGQLDGIALAIKKLQNSLGNREHDAFTRELCIRELEKLHGYL